MPGEDSLVGKTVDPLKAGERMKPGSEGGMSFSSSFPVDAVGIKCMAPGGWRSLPQICL